jgi:hypothetical protein
MRIFWHDVQHGLFHFDKGMYYSAKELYWRPGHSIREFIEGKRVSHLSQFHWSLYWPLLMVCYTIPMR